MAITQTQIDALESALLSGELMVRYDGKQIQYRSIAELRSALAYARAQLAQSTAQGPVRQTVAVFTRGA